MIRTEVTRHLSELGVKIETQESLDYLIGYGCGKCLNSEYIAKLIKQCSEEIDINDSESVLEWIIDRECD